MEELSVVYREYYGISWGKALDAVGVPADSDLRWPETVYYDPEIRELLGPDSSNPEQAPKALKRPLVDQAPPAPLEVPKESSQTGGQGKKAEVQDKKKTSFNPKEKAPDVATSQPDQIVDLLAPKTKA